MSSSGEEDRPHVELCPLPEPPDEGVGYPVELAVDVHRRWGKCGRRWFTWEVRVSHDSGLAYKKTSGRSGSDPNGDSQLGGKPKLGR